MTRVLILSSNVLAEQELQLKLQQMNYEVFVSSSILKQSFKEELANLLVYFRVVIFSEHLLEEEIQAVLSFIKGTDVVILRRVYQQAVIETQDAYICLSVNASPVEVKQVIETTRLHQDIPESMNVVSGKRNLLQEVRLTPNELTLIQYLYQKRDHLVTKEMICQKLWHQQVSDSRKVQIYTLIGQLKRKLGAVKSHSVFIESQRANGYYLTPKFFQMFYIEFPAEEREGAGEQ